MEPPALRPRPMPGAHAGPRPDPAPAVPEEPPAGRPAGRRAAAGLALLLTGAALGVLAAAWAGPAPASGPALAARLGVEVTDAGRPGALVVGVQNPGPGHTAGLREGDLLLAVGATRVGTAADLAREVFRIPPGTPVRLTVRHPTGGYQQLTAVPGILM
ncbi:PDZ domain-containing protein [Streptomyces sp. HNS054]|uniref:PDZ domain-containing protein n=1 Tax=Streptomyces sp. HNS054 TaxID=1662446 RepID=UPI0006543EEE|nr:PDZ domain-containing protein [Streptomyces sp. HNS054]WPW22085.1 PDZ domain-containing protein [Streptomyces griseoincarnatus]